MSVTALFFEFKGTRVYLTALTAGALTNFARLGTPRKRRYRLCILTPTSTSPATGKGPLRIGMFLGYAQDPVGTCTDLFIPEKS